MPRARRALTTDVAARQRQGEKEAVLAAGRKGFFTIPHFAGYPAVLIQLERATKRDVRDALEDAWLAAAPRALADRYLGHAGD